MIEQHPEEMSPIAALQASLAASPLLGFDTGRWADGSHETGAKQAFVGYASGSQSTQKQYSYLLTPSKDPDNPNGYFLTKQGGTNFTISDALEPGESDNNSIGDRPNDLFYVSSGKSIRDFNYIGKTQDNAGIAGNSNGSNILFSDEDFGDGTSVTLTKDPYIVCYGAGTLIRTVDGEVVVEALRIGDLVVSTTGQHRPIRWIGSRTIDCRSYAEPQNVLPVRIAASALGQNRPARDLVVSPGHAICLDVLGEVLIPASALVNGLTITQQDVEAVTYWHVELDNHDILFAEGQPAESYLDIGDRGFFSESNVVGLTATPDAAAARAHAGYCRPFHMTGPIVEAVRARLRTRAKQLGWNTLHPDPSLCYSGRTPGTLKGYLDGCQDGVVWGWAYDSDHPDVAIALDVLVDGAVVGWVDADEHRADVRAAGHGSGAYGFHFTLPDHLARDDAHVIEVRRAIDRAGLPITDALARHAA